MEEEKCKERQIMNVNNDNVAKQEKVNIFGISLKNIRPYT